MASRLKQAAAVMAIAVATVAVWEGVRTRAYKDVVGVPTVCYGETRGVKLGDRYTLEECKVMLGEGLVEFEAMIRPCLRNPDSIPDKTYASFISLAYNIGARGFCRSTVVKRWNAGNHYGACDAMLMWNKAGGRVIKGLVNRRNDERRLCREGVKEGTVTLHD
jgi:lysozyme